MKDGDFSQLYDSSKISGATDIGMPKGHVACIPLVLYWSRRPMDSKLRKPKEDEDVRIGKQSYYRKLVINIGKGLVRPDNLYLCDTEKARLRLLYKGEAEDEIRDRAPLFG